jgi:hypothetical protein
MGESGDQSQLEVMEKKNSFSLTRSRNLDRPVARSVPIELTPFQQKKIILIKIYVFYGNILNTKNYKYIIF